MLFAAAPCCCFSGASPTQENMKGSTAIDLAKTETTLTLLCPLHYCAARGMLDNLVAEVAKVPPPRFPTVVFLFWKKKLACYKEDGAQDCRLLVLGRTT